MRVLVAEDQWLLRQGLVALLTSAGCTVVAEVDHGEQIVPAVREHRPDIAILDIRMPPTHRDEGLRAAHRLRAEIPGQPVLILSQYVERLYVDELLADRRGGIGYLLKDRVFDADQLMRDITAIVDGGTIVDPTVVAELLARRTNTDRLARLTARERQTLELMARGASNESIAEHMTVTVKAVAKHINSLMSKLDLPIEEGPASRRVLAVLAFLGQ